VFSREETGNLTATPTMMPLRVTVSTAAVAADLLSYLCNLGADAHMDGDRTITVFRRHAVVPGEPAYQDRLELEFVLRTWARGRNGADYDVEYAATC
jgi:hypothetical protein